jgi:hypothetical protein
MVVEILLRLSQLSLDFGDEIRENDIKLMVLEKAKGGVVVVNRTMTRKRVAL